MTLTNLTEFPPYGYLYKNPTIPWEAPADLAMQGLRAVAAALQTAILNNPTCGLDPSMAACVESVKQYQCARFQNRPAALARFCGGPMPQQQAFTRQSGHPITPGCASCGGGRR